MHVYYTMSMMYVYIYVHIVEHNMREQAAFFHGLCFSSCLQLLALCFCSGFPSL